jgi:hypothetical protein
VNVSVQSLPGVETLGDDLGEAEVTGEVGAIVEGYGAALDRLTQELMRMMRTHELLVVWLFDQSESMKDDQLEIKSRLHRVYEELKLVDSEAANQPRRKNKDQDILLTAIASFGDKYHVHTPKPTGKTAELMAAIEQIPVDPTGNENTCQSIMAAIGQFRGYTARGGRKLVLVVVSDESGDDGEYVEDAIQMAKSARAPIYILGREAVFGSLYAHVQWRQPETGHLFYLPIRRGPETPFAEQLQYDGFRRRRDSHMSGFGPYEQVRICRDTGGIFFQLPHEQQDLNDLDNRKFEMLDVREYLPKLESRREYAAQRDQSPFRKAIWDVIVMLNPYEPANQGLELPDHEWFHVTPAESNSAVVERLKQITLVLAGMAAAQQRLESVKGLRGKEPSVRWRANYDLMYAQLYAYRVRLFQYAIALDQFGKTMPQRIKNPKSNRWSIRTGVAQLVMPDAAQEKFLKITGDQLKEAHQKAREQLAFVVQEHPRTSWARRAEWELSRNFGAGFGEHTWVPSPPGKPGPKPTPPPKL